MVPFYLHDRESILSEEQKSSPGLVLDTYLYRLYERHSCFTFSVGRVRRELSFERSGRMSVRVSAYTLKYVLK